MWYYVLDGSHQGPFDDAALDHLIATGIVTADTYMWKDGMADWAPLGQARPMGSPTLTATADAPLGTCSICGKRVGAENLIDLLGNRVCSDCKPMAVQTLKEGAARPVKNFAAWRDGKKVVAHSKTSLPARCYKCNEAVETLPMTRKLYWHPVFYYLLIFFNILVYAVIAMIVRKRATLDIYLCEQHRQRRNYFIIGGWSGAILGIILVCVAIAMNTGWLIGLGLILVVAAMIVGVAGAQLARPAKIKGETIWLTGAGKEFLASLPDWPSAGR
jgi:hypothetical protein